LRIILTGGELRLLSQTMVGPLTRAVLDKVRVDKAFMGTMGFSFGDGLTTTDPNEAFTKDLVQKQARQVILLADSRKWGKVSFSRVSGFEGVDVLITDKKFPAKDARVLRKQDVKVRLV
ncbi:MAG: DeoR/GlpR family DNA-binding transcription regulator, partial [Verrucomicrobiota bacterium]|nr:DeoR/GlpR family DNA-binding transcription regulator [Verrucomicrobiota bacterium]